jgi:hypothetical protein
MHYARLDGHKKTISYCVKDAAGCVLQEGKIGSPRRELGLWVRTLLQPRMIAKIPYRDRFLIDIRKSAATTTIPMIAT